MADQETQEVPEKPSLTLVSGPKTLSNRHLQMSDGYQKTRQDLLALSEMEEDEDYTRPTKYALDLTLDLLETCRNEMASHGDFFPRASSSASEKGGLYLFWEEEEGSIQLTVPPVDGGMYSLHVLYDGQSSMIRGGIPQKLTEELASFNRRHLSMQGYTNAPSSAVA
jgi:hypothetical protein